MQHMAGMGLDLAHFHQAPPTSRVPEASVIGSALMLPPRIPVPGGAAQHLSYMNVADLGLIPAHQMVSQPLQVEVLTSANWDPKAEQGSGVPRPKAAASLDSTFLSYLGAAASLARVL